MLAAIDANTGRRGNQSFDFIGEQGFSGKAGELRASDRGANTLLLGDLDGDGRAEFVSTLLGVSDLSAGTMLL